ncbi:hypothetical protein FA13DRAFT_1706357 [Coprinellus micaceus]|uniref:Uncharacterized protein n=1 Tax=Coprinellus micaceus TaxID=71717 RepID=A0A4Y7TPC6_COPMI|nr:hypothetical protein FA13DRAFT_1706357 [Coprinellus micaceus]
MPSSPVPPTAASKNWAHRLFQDPAMLDSSPIIAVNPGGADPTAPGVRPEKEKMDPICVSDPGFSTPLKGCADDCGGTTLAAKPRASSLTFPFSAHRRKVAPPGVPSPIKPRSVPEPPVRQKHVFVSSPLRNRQDPAQGSDSDTVSCPSEFDASSARKPRPSHHGRSRHSLLLTKWVWSSRRAHHEEHASVGDTPLYPPSGYGAAPLADRLSLPTLHPGKYRPRLHRRMPSFYMEEKKLDQPPLTMYPRQGEVSALRDPYCARADRSFAIVPIWTLKKILYLFALHLPQSPITEDALTGDAFEDAGSEASFNTESEGSTLVGSECDSEWDSGSVSTACSSRQDESDDDITFGDHDTIGRMKGHNLLSLAARRVNREPDVCTLHMTSAAWLCRLYRDPRAESLKLTFGQPRSSWERRNHNQRQPKNTWPSCWYGRWELLIELAARDGPVEATTPTEKAKAKLRAPQPKEFRWLKLLGGKGAAKPVKPAPVAHPVRQKSQATSGVVKTSESVGQVSCGGDGQPGWLPLLESSHPAAG